MASCSAQAVASPRRSSSRRAPGSYHGQDRRSEDGRGGQRQRVRAGRRGSAGAVHLHHEEEDGEED